MQLGDRMGLDDVDESDLARYIREQDEEQRRKMADRPGAPTREQWNGGSDPRQHPIATPEPRAQLPPPGPGGYMPESWKQQRQDPQWLKDHGITSPVGAAPSPALASVSASRPWMTPTQAHANAAPGIAPTAAVGGSPMYDKFASQGARMGQAANPAAGAMQVAGAVRGASPASAAAPAAAAAGAGMGVAAPLAVLGQYISQKQAGNAARKDAQNQIRAQYAGSLGYPTYGIQAAAANRAADDAEGTNYLRDLLPLLRRG